MRLVCLATHSKSVLTLATHAKAVLMLVTQYMQRNSVGYASKQM